MDAFLDRDWKLQGVIMVRYLSVVFLVGVLVLNAVDDAKAILPSATLDKGKCLDLLSQLKNEYNQENWRNAHSVLSTLTSCSDYASKDSSFTKLNFVRYRVSIEYQLENYKTVIEFLENRAYNDIFTDKKNLALINHYGYLAAYQLGLDEIAVEKINLAAKYRNSLLPIDQLEILVLQTYANINSGNTAKSLETHSSINYIVNKYNLPHERVADSYTAIATSTIYSHIDTHQKNTEAIDDAVSNLEKALQHYLKSFPERTAVVTASKALAFSLLNKQSSAERIARSAINSAEESNNEMTIWATNLLAARVNIYGGNAGTALDQLETAERYIRRTESLAGLSELEELRALAYNLNGRIDLAARSMWRLNMMDAPGAEHRMRMASLSIIGIGSFLPWGIATALLCLVAGFVAVHGSRRMQQILPEPDPNLHYMSMGSLFFQRRSRPQDDSGTTPLPDGSLSEVLDRLTAMMPTPPTFSDLYRDPQVDMLEEDPNAARALHLLNLTTGDAEQLFDHVADALPDFSEPPSHVRLKITTSHAIEPVDRDDNRWPVYECALTDNRFSVAPSSRPPVLTIHLGPDADPEQPLPAIVLHPSIVAEGSDAVLRAVTLLAARRMLVGLDALREGIVLDRGLWGSSIIEEDAPFIPAWRDV